MEEDRRVGLTLELLEHGRGEAGVDGSVPVMPRRMERAIDLRRVCELPQRMLDEPQHRVRDDVVVPIVRLLVVRDQVQAIRRAVLRGLLERLAGAGAILVAHRARDPRHVVVAEQAAQRGREPAAATASRPVCLEGDGTTVGDDDQLPAHSAVSLSG